MSRVLCSNGSSIPVSHGPHLAISTTGKRAAQIMLCILNTVHGFLPTHWNKSTELLVLLRTLQDSQETHFWFVLHTFPLKLRWLIISKHSTDLRIFSYFIYINIYFYSFICLRNKSWDKRKGMDYLKAVRCNYIHELPMATCLSKISLFLIL